MDIENIEAHEYLTDATNGLLVRLQIYFILNNYVNQKSI